MINNDFPEEKSSIFSRESRFFSWFSTILPMKTYRQLEQQATEKPEPHDLEAEKNLLGCLFIQPTALYDALQHFSPSDFYRNSHFKLFTCFQEMLEKEHFNDHSIDLKMMVDYLKFRTWLSSVGDVKYLCEVMDSTPTAANIVYYAKRIHELAERRRMIHTVVQVALNCYDELTPIERTRQEILDFQLGQNTDDSATKIDLSTPLYKEEPLITLNDQLLMAKADMMGIVSGIGRGKSNVCEVIASVYQNPYCESDGVLKVTKTEEEGVCLYLDTERTQNDAVKSLHRIHKRIGAEHDDSLVINNEFRFLRYYNLVRLSTPGEKYAEVLRLIHTIPHIELVILDGMLDMFNNMNDIEEVTKKMSQFYALTNSQHFGLLYTIHENRNDTSGKGQGHVGGLIQKRSSAFFRLSKVESDPQIRVLHSMFENGKVRAGRDTDLYTAFMWCDQAHMFREIPIEPYMIADLGPNKPGKPERKNGPTAEEKFAQVFDLFNEYEPITYTTLATAYAEKWDLTVSGAKKAITRALERGIIERDQKTKTFFLP